MASILPYEIPSSAVVAIFRRHYLQNLKALKIFQTEARLCAMVDEANQIRNNSRVNTTAFSRMGMRIGAQRSFF
jgi:hypothetical protein